MVDRTVIRNDADAHGFAAALSAAPRSFVGRTAIGSAIDFSFALFGEPPSSSDRREIDVSGDGTSNQGRPVTDARDAAIGAGAVINGLTIFNRRAAAHGGYLAAHTKVRRGAGAGVLSVDGWQITGPQNLPGARPLRIWAGGHRRSGFVGRHRDRTRDDVAA